LAHRQKFSGAKHRVSAFADRTQRSPESLVPDGGILRQLSVNEVFGLAVVDKDLRVLRFNRKFTSFYQVAGKSTELLCDMLRKDCAVPDGCDNCPARRCLKSGIESEREFARLLPNAQEQYFRFVASPLARSADSPAEQKQGQAKQIQPVHSKPLKTIDKTIINGLTLVLIEDITRKREIEQKLLRAQRLEVMSTMAGGIAHEINQPLSALNLYASGLQILLDKEEQPSLQIIRERVTLILEQSRKISDITKHMWAMANKSATALEEVDVKNTLQDVLQNLQDKLQAAQVAVDIVAPDALPLVKAIGVQLSQVFNNLLVNALHALETQPEGARPRRIRVSLKPENSRLRIEVADSGPGVAPGMQRRIFDLFFSTKGPGGGMGLGLTLVHAFVQSWGGEVQVSANHPELGGAVFTVTLSSIG
jgi:C4-dicarboxylate-specific signal transduction histidine kinase